jgi:hypothetical protein
MSNVWLLPRDLHTAPEAKPDDHLVRVIGEDAEIARMTRSGPEWLGAVPASSLGALPTTVQEAIVLEDLPGQIAVQGAASALVERGG